VGTSPDYTQAYLNAVMQKYLDQRKGMRADQGSHMTTAITEQLIQVEKDLRNGEDEMLEFQKEHNIGFIQEEGNSAAAYLVKLNQDYAKLKTEFELLRLLDLDQNLDRQQVAPRPSETTGVAAPTDDNMSFAEFGPEGEYLKARSAAQLLKAERDTLSKDLRPRHPKILKLNDEIEKQEQLINLYRQDAVEKLDTRRKSIGTQMENLQSNIKEWEKKALVLSQQLGLARFQIEQAYSLGAVDYLVKPLIPAILRAKVAVFVELFQQTEQVFVPLAQYLVDEHGWRTAYRVLGALLLLLMPVAVLAIPWRRFAAGDPELHRDAKSAGAGQGWTLASMRPVYTERARDWPSLAYSRPSTRCGSAPHLPGTRPPAGWAVVGG
jgi:uncharacterized protein YicC (UPF0701 family)